MTIKSKKFEKGIRLKSTTSPATEDGEIRNDSTNPASHRLKVKLEGELEQEIVTADQAQSLSNKTIDSANNIITVDADEATVQNLEVANLKAGVLETDLNNPVDDTKLPSAQAVKSYVAQEVATKDEASEISYSNVTSGLTATNVQAAIDEVEARLDTAEADVVTAQSTADNHIADATDAHAASAITNTPSGNLIATDVQSALNELQSDVDGRALDSALQDHINDATDAHDATAVSYDNTTSGLTATEVQAAIDEVEGRLDTAESNITAADSALSDHLTDTEDAHDASAISVVPAGNLESTEVQAALEELQSDIDTRALDSDLTTHVSATAAHGTTGDVVGTSDTQTLTNKTIDGATITAPAQLDVKQDTLANLTTYATTATNGQIVFATDTKQMFQVIDASLTAIGGGGAGGSAFDQNQVAHGLAVLDAIYHNGTSWVKAQANDAATLATHIVSAVADADNFTAQNFGRFEATSHGKTVGEFYFLSESVAGGSDTVEGSVYSAPLYYVEDANTIHALVYRPSLRPQNTQFREDVDVLENILAFDTTSAGFSTETTINGESFRLTHDASVTRFAEVDIAVTPKFRDKILELPVDLKSTATSGNFKVIITDQTNAKTLADEVLQPQSGSETVKRVVSFSTKPADGDLAIATIRVRFEALAESGAVSDFDDVLVQLKKTQSLEVIAIEQEENVFSAKIANNGTASVISQSSPFISSVTRTGAGIVVVNFKNGFFSETPAVVATRQGGYDDFTTVANISTSSATVITDSSAVSGVDVAFEIMVQRQGSDYRNLERRIEREVSTFKQVLVEEADSEIRLGGNFALASTNTRVLYASQVLSSRGSSVKYNSSSTLGDSFEILEDGVYHLHASCFFTESAAFGFTKNSSNLNVSPDQLPQTEVLSSSFDGTGLVPETSATAYLKAGDIIRLQSSNVNQSNANYNVWSITKQGSLKKASVAPDSKIKIPTSELRMEGSSSRGSGSELFTVQFNTLTKIRGNSVTVNNSNGSVFTVQKDGKLSLSVSFRANASGQQAYITKNSANPATFPSTSEILASDRSNSVDYTYSMSCEIFVKAGDVLRVACENAPTNVDYNVLEITHQEQDISVAVSNVTPQFEDADSMVRLRGGNGTGANGVIRRFSSIEANLGSAITYTDSQTDGASFTIEETGVYHITYFHAFNSIADFGITLNASDINVGIGASVNSLNRLAMGRNPAADVAEELSWSGVLQKGDVVRAHSDGGTDSSLESGNRVLFTIAKVGVPSIAEVDVTPFSDVNRVVRESAHFYKHQAYGSTATRIPYFANQVKTTFKDLGIVSNSSVNGFSFTATKRCKVTASYSVKAVSVNACYAAFSLNATSSELTQTIDVVDPSKVLGISRGPDGAHTVSTCSIIMEAGDVLRPHAGYAQDSNYASLTITAEADSRTTMYSVAQTENEFSARISAAGAILSESQNFIDSVTALGSGLYRINFKTGFFTSIPQINVTSTGNASTNTAYIRTDFTLNTEEVNVQLVTGSSGTDKDFNLHVSRQGADRKDLQKAIVQLSDFPRVNRTLRQYFEHNTTVSTFGSTSTLNPVLNNPNIIDNFQVFDVLTDSVDGTRFVMKKDGQISLSATANFNSTNQSLEIKRNGNTITRVFDNQATGPRENISATVKGLAGDVFTVNRGGTNPLTFEYVNVYGEAQELERVTNIDKTENVFSARIANNGTASIVSESQNFIDSVVRESQGVVRVNFISGFFTEVPSVQAAVSADAGLTYAGTRSAEWGDLDTTGVRIYTKFSDATNNSVFDYNFHLEVSRQGADYTSIQDVVVGLNPNTIEEKFLSADNPTSSTGDLSDLQFTNLEVGKWYHLTGHMKATAAASTTHLNFRSGPGGTGDFYGRATHATTASSTQNIAISLKFKATSTTMYSNVSSAGGPILGDGTKQETFLQLEKLSNTEG